MTNNGTVWGAAHIIKCLHGRTSLVQSIVQSNNKGPFEATA